MSLPASNQTNPIVVDATGYAPYAVKRTEIARSGKDAEARKAAQRAAAIQRFWIREKSYRENEKYTEKHGKDLFRSQWECQADKKGIYSQVRWEMDKIKTQQQNDLEQRRYRLREMLQKDQDTYFAEEKAKQPTLRLTQAEMTERYRNILRQKELERQKIVQEKTEQQFRLNCDPLRAAASKKISILTAREGAELGKQKNMLMKEKEMEDEMYTTALMKDIEAKYKKELELKQQKKTRDIQYGKYLEEQICGSNITKYDTPEKELQCQLLDEQRRLLEIEKQWEKMQEKMKQERTRKDLDKCLKDKLKRRAKEVQEDLMLDSYFLNQIYSIDIERKRQEEKKKALRKEQEEYLAYISDLMKKEQEFEKSIEPLFQVESDKIWEKREREWAAEKKRRDELNKKAILECREQIRNRMEKCRVMEKLKVEYDEEIKKQVEHDKEEILKHEQEVRKKNIQYREELLEQIKDKERRLDERKAALQKEIEEMKQSEKEYDLKIKSILAQGKIDNLHPFRT